ncbi:bifunctional phosphoribosylaminoimidazolecarboxamide formyltransferase/IMP cyclohydrolase [Candidatus Liberibacter solanacearum CLso-ZC1]|uniref:Bifunctional purine biosynthesis protein PurH n=1 Tax=Liberibacter solanacearum (strain CLso-ZC1) TaxID=658172 RepID=E4UCR2_LIBSC|nr:bifunctional phosphoribosylaminoimidazolecarboxamide formyltransferase/IMP cyclohydrolase [Candidatus Liberibacter solanacearum]ADR52153.1 bifunctional phosphoribosylaminoimidazolecarboxamide formyltransferase/IMP cyclohydrolase [Candidatus Liberibacter solanacearum CLso-ZC1]
MDFSHRKYCGSDEILVKNALISVYDKTGIVEFSRRLLSWGIKLVSTGGTCQLLEKENIPVTNISDITGFPEIMDGRVKTLHPKIYGGLLGIRDNPEHMMAMREHGLESIDLVVVNLYPFEESCLREDEYHTIVENIDIGGPSMIRAAAKNHDYVTVLTDSKDYPLFLSEMESNNGKVLLNFRKKMALQAFFRTASYDAAICRWFANAKNEDFPDYLNITGTKKQEMRYGENPHQKAALYSILNKKSGIANATLVQGKPLSYNNINDLDAAYELVSEFSSEDCAACVIVKHTNPCGVAIADTLLEAYRRALSCDPMSAFGGIVAFNQALDQEVAREVIKIFTEVIVAPNISKEAEVVISEKPNMRFLKTFELSDPRAQDIVFKTVSGGILVQTRDNNVVDDQELTVVTKRSPTPKELSDMKFALKIVKHVKSNAVVFAKEGRTIGIGSGQTSRVDSTRFAAIKSQGISAQEGIKSVTSGAVIASEAFYPFPDGILEAIKAGVTAVIQPGGSIRDLEIISVADQHNIAMVFTGIRHFRH